MRMLIKGDAQRVPRASGCLLLKKSTSTVTPPVENGKRHNIKRRNQPPEGTIEIPPPSVSPALKQRWGLLIKKVYETDPLICHRCGGAMRIIALIDQPDVIEMILTQGDNVGTEAHHEVKICCLLGENLHCDSLDIVRSVFLRPEPRTGE